MPQPLRYRRGLFVAMVAVIFLWMYTVSLTGSAEPVYQGRRLGKWLRGHPNEYRPAVRAVGTNALPYLLEEMRATDSALAQFAEKTLAKASMGAFWQTARTRRYRAGLALQILDTNAAPAVINLIFSAPIRCVEGDAGYSAAFSLKWLDSPAAANYVEERLLEALQSKDPMMRRNACLAFSIWSAPSHETALSLTETTRDVNPAVRAAAVRALLVFHYTAYEPLFMPALALRLDDEEAVVRRVAIGALQERGTNAVTAAAALRSAYAAEPLRTGPRDNLENGYYDASEFSAAAIQEAIRSALNKIDPSGAAPPGVR